MQAWWTYVPSFKNIKTSYRPQTFERKCNITLLFLDFGHIIYPLPLNQSVYFIPIFTDVDNQNISVVVFTEEKGGSETQHMSHT